MTDRSGESWSERWRRLTGGDPAADVDEELAFHLECRARELEARGVAADEARERARARFGDLQEPRRACLEIARRRDRRMARRESWTEIATDLRYGWRALVRHPGFAAVAILTIALGVGANSAVFSVVDGVLLRGLPYSQPERLVRVHHANPSEDVAQGDFSPQDFADVAAAAETLSSVSAYFHQPGQSGVNLRAPAEPVRLEAAFVDGAFFSTLGVAAEEGRTLGPGDQAPARNRVIVLSDRAWERWFGRDPDTVGGSVFLDGEPYTLAGVLPPGFDFPTAGTDVWLPVSLIEDDDIPHLRGLRWLDAVGRLAPGSDLAAARAELSGVVAGLAAAHPESNEGWIAVTVVPLYDAVVGEVRPALVALAWAVALVLLVACVNVANLLLTRGTSRGRELAVRVALGAGRARLVRQLLTESLGLALVGGLAGLAVAAVGVAVFRKLAASQLPRVADIGLDGRTVAFTLVVSCLAALLFGALPALAASRPRAVAGLRTGARAGDAGASGRLRAALVIAETALAVLLLVGAGLVGRSLWRLTHVDPGFRSADVLAFSITYPDGSDVLGRRDRLLARLREIPGVLAVGGSKTWPLHGGGEPMSFALPARPDAAITPDGGMFIVTPGFFEALRIPVLRGRAFRAEDTEGPPAVIVNRALAAQLWPGDDAVGRTVTVGEHSLEVVGVVGDVRAGGLATAAEPALYLPGHLARRSTTKVFLRTRSAPETYVAAVRSAVREVEPDLPIADLAPFSELVGRTVVQPRLLATLLGAFGAAAFGLALVGLYGVIAFAVAQRRAEIGIRLALGAEARDVVRSVLGRTALLAGAGLALGSVAALAAGRLLASQLFQVDARDPVTFAVVALVLGAGSLLAGWVPARRAARVEPVSALRAE